MRRLTELGVVARAERGVGGIRSGSEGYVFGLSGLGHAVLDRDQPGARRHRSAIESKSTFTAHILACSELMCQLVEHSRAGGCTIEELRAEPGCWRWFSSQSGGRRPLKPDAYVRLTVDDFDLAAFIEIDLATESLPTIASKCAVYLDYWRSGAEQRVAGFFPRVWWLVPHPDRAGAISRTIQRLAPAEQRLFAVALIEDAVAALTTTPHTDTKGGAQ